LKEAGEDPPALRNKPTLWPWNRLYYEAFLTLSPSRQQPQGGVGAIPLSEYKAYFDLLGIGSTEERSTWIKMVRALDRTYVDVMRDRIETQRAAQKRQTSSAPKARRSGRRRR